MRRLVIDGAAAARGVERCRPPRPVKEVGEVERGDHPQPAMRAAFYQFPGQSDGSIEAVAVADDQMLSAGARRVAHCAALLQRERHRLLDERMLAGAEGEARMLRMQLVGR